MTRLRFFMVAAGLLPAGPMAAQLIPWSEVPSVASVGPTVAHPASPKQVLRRGAEKAVRKADPVEVALAQPSGLVEALWADLVSPAESFLLSSFSPTDVGGVRASTSWVGNVTPHAGTITVGGAALDDNGWGATGLTLNASAMNFVTITAQRDAGNLTPSLFIQFEDQTLRTKFYSVSTELFAVGVPTTVSIPLSGWTIDFGPSVVTGWSIGGGSVGSVALRMTFDELSLSASAIPEPGSVALLAGGAALLAGFVRRRVRIKAERE